MSDSQIHLATVKLLYKEVEWAALVAIPAFAEALTHLNSLEEVTNALRLGLDLLERTRKAPTALKD